MSRARVTSVHSQSLAHKAGIVPGDVITAINGEPLRDVIRYHELVNQATVTMTIERSGIETDRVIERGDDVELGIELDAPTFDRIRTCDNHCPFCFIYQLPKGMRETLYVKDDDYRLSFLYGNFTTMTRFNELDLERVIDEQLSPLYVSVHATDPDVRTTLLRNKRGAVSLRWLRPLLDNGIDVHMQVVVCPGINDGEVLRATLEDIADQYPDVSSIAVVPLGVSDHSNEELMIPHTMSQAQSDIAIVEEFQRLFMALKKQRTVYVSDEYYIIAGMEIPSLENYDDLSQTENGVGMVAEFRDVFSALMAGESSEHAPRKTGFFQWVEAAPAFGYREEKLDESSTHSVPSVVAGDPPVIQSVPPVVAGDPPIIQSESLSSSRGRSPKDLTIAPIMILTGEYAAGLLAPLLAELSQRFSIDIEIRGVKNLFFGGNIKVAGLVTGEDILRELESVDDRYRVVLPDVMLTKGLFIDGVELASINRPLSVIETSAPALYEFVNDHVAGKTKKVKNLLPMAGGSPAQLSGCGSGEML